MIELQDRTCIEAMLAGLYGIDRKYPRCIGEECNKYECCVNLIIQNNITLDKFVAEPEPGSLAEWVFI